MGLERRRKHRRDEEREKENEREERTEEDEARGMRTGTRMTVDNRRRRRGR